MPAEKNGQVVYMETQQRLVEAIEAEVSKAVLGKRDVIRKILTVIIAGGHILLEDIPGVGKTTLALAFSRALDLEFHRVQFTPDVVPSDITGFSVYDKETGNFEYKPGAAMCNIFLADEINRTSSKTQSALLEVMQEGSITVDGVTHVVPKPFVVIATQNPVGTAGTQMLPEAQLDRFMIQLSMGYPDAASEIRLLMDRREKDPLESIRQVADRRYLMAMRKAARQTYMHEKIYEYITELCRATRVHPLVKLGVSPRGALALCTMAQAWAFAKGRNYVTPQDVRDIFDDVCRHRIILSSKAHVQGKGVLDITREILHAQRVPGISETGERR